MDNLLIKKFLIGLGTWFTIVIIFMLLFWILSGFKACNLWPDTYIGTTICVAIFSVMIALFIACSTEDKDLR